MNDHLDIHSVEFYVLPEAEFEKHLRNAIKDNEIPAKGIISVAKRDPPKVSHDRKESWVIIWREDRIHR